MFLRADSGSLDSGIRSYLGQASEHDADHGEADEGNDGGGVSLEVASEPAIASDPGKGALDDPSLGQDGELVGFTPFDDFKLPSTGIGNDLCDPWPPDRRHQRRAWRLMGTGGQRRATGD